ncbi:hypothetical protein [Bacillus sp. Marseille-Q1617]|uniref:hypothetical protein n=1 Tax=Bacillus sp. Marseille-Q1617 TaxID=2736887 RepID=UPI00158BDDC0|nr:hypothetical protein [Bacillus sp. Marseille-Q1617]
MMERGPGDDMGSLFCAAMGGLFFTSGAGMRGRVPDVFFHYLVGSIKNNPNPIIQLESGLIMILFP